MEESTKSDLKKGFRETAKDIRRVFNSRFFTKVIIIVGMLVSFVLVFGLGVAVGFHKASFGQAWGEHYRENFMVGRGGEMGFMAAGMGGKTFNIFFKGDMSGFPNAHGAAGKILSINLPEITVQDKDNTEKVIVVKDATVIERGREILKNTDLKVDDFVVVIGAPNEQGQIEAKLIRDIPSPEFLK
jgi:hypothetical protein